MTTTPDQTPNETLTAVSTVPAPATAVFAVLADPATHQAIDGTGWVRESLDAERLTGTGQIFRMAMYHPNHPDGDYEMSNRVLVFDAPHAISWEPGYRAAGSDGLQFGGWTWRYDLAAVGESETQVTLSYDWSAVPAQVREHLPFPPFPPEHLRNSLSHLAELAASRHASSG